MKRNSWLDSFQSLTHLIGELQLDGTLIIAIDMLKELKGDICNWPLLIRKFPILSTTMKINHVSILDVTRIFYQEICPNAPKYL